MYFVFELPKLQKILFIPDLATHPTNQIKIILYIHEAINVFEMIAIVLRYSIFNDYKYNKSLLYIWKENPKTLHEVEMNEIVYGQINFNRMDELGNYSAGL